MTAHTPSGGPLVDGPHDPEHHPAATYALEPDYVANLTRHVLSTTGETALARTPITGQPLGTVPQSSVADVDEAFKRARAAQAKWAQTSLEERAACLMRLHDLILERQAEILDLVVWESAKSRLDAYNEALHVALTARYYARTGHEHLDTRQVPGVIPVLTRTEINRVPKGVVGIISPWNYPFTMALCDGLPALMAGNAVVAKPDAQTMLSALIGAELLEQARFPKDLWIIVAGPGRIVGTEIMEQADYVCFTGSTATGKIVAAKCAERLIGCSLELGGKNPFIVLKDADIERAAQGAVRATFSNAGQLCVSTERLLVADEVYDKFMDAFVRRTNAMSLGASLDWGVNMGSLISQDQLDTVTAHVDDAVAKGATVLTGGKARPDLAPYYYEPTILANVTPDMTCFGHETFGPVISAYRFSDEDEAIAIANQGEYGLNGALFTKDGKRGRELAKRIKCGTVNINEAYAATFASIAAPMGGMRESGMGRRQGAEGILRYTEAQSVATQRVTPIAPAFGLNDKQWAKVMTLGVKVLTKLGKK
jgi:succinate-semialdehyde dehydrogenase/glutarate-semialdehyde dehydrogenase